MKTLIISGGSIHDGFALDFINEKQPDFIIAADRGLEFCYRQNIRPDCIVGDFDSIDPEVIRFYREKTDLPIYTFRPEKDMTDTDIAVKKAEEAGADEIFFLGCTGSRLDHVLSCIYNLSLLREKGIRGWIADPNNLITMPLGKFYEITEETQFGTYISLFPFGLQVEGLTLTGMKYPLTDAVLVLGDGGLGVSNERTDQTACIRWKRGTLIVVESRDRSGEDIGI
ncbi:MAG: thiamine diphosphokinase [Lachnospiraceae bacterium]|nr:thiamine diphosphokinase [Lachnospiraceae bacterium]